MGDGAGAGPLVMGVDASMSSTALVVMRKRVVVHWSLVTTKGEDRGQRLMKLYDATADVIRRHRPVACFLEKPGGWARWSEASMQQTVEVLAQARAACLLACSAERVTAYEVPVVSIRSLITSGLRRKGTPNKVAVLRYLQLMQIPVPEKDGSPLHDVADGIMACLYGQSRLAQTTAQVPERRERRKRSPAKARVRRFPGL
jgi:Holliday junction resolvasome RuvABC endonuclease subunit